MQKASSLLVTICVLNGSGCKAIADQPGSLTIIVRVRKGLAERRATKAVVAVADPPVAVPVAVPVPVSSPVSCCWFIAPVTML